MAAAADKARFYLEQCVPELRELESKKIFDRNEIQAVNRKRSDFEHKLNAPGSKPLDWARYLEYELNLDLLRRKRAKRLNARVTKHAGPRRIFALLERATSKFQGDLGLWMQYLDYAKRQKANKRISTIWTKVVRLHPTKPELWVEAGRYAFDEQSDMVAARSYMQRGLRFCQRSRELWLAYFRLELDYLAKVSARAESMGVGQGHGTAADGMIDDEDENQLMLPSATAEDAFRDEEGRDVIGAEALQVLSQSPALSGAIPIAIFDAAIRSPKMETATDLALYMFDATADYNMPSRQTILEHIFNSMSSLSLTNASAQIITIRYPVLSTRINTAEFARNLAASISELMRRLGEEGPEPERLHLLSARWLVSYLQTDGIDSGIHEAVRATLEQIITSYQKMLSRLDGSAGETHATIGFGLANEMLGLLAAVEPRIATEALLETVKRRWPSKVSTLDASRDLVITQHG